MSDLIYTPAQLAEQLGVCIETIRDLTAAGRIPHVQLSPQRVIYYRKAIEEWLDCESSASMAALELEADGAHIGLRRGVA